MALGLRTDRSGFTLVELLVVIAVVGVVVGLLLPAVQNVRAAAARIQCANNLKQIGLGLQHYHDTSQCFPPGYMSTSATADPNFVTAPGWGWASFTLPYLEQGALYSQIEGAIRSQTSITDPSVGSAIQAHIPLLLCPADVTPPGSFPVYSLAGNTSYPLVYKDGAPGTIEAGPCSYADCVGRDEDSDADGVYGSGVFYCNSRTRFNDIKDGASNTILVGERAWSNANGVWAGAIPGCAMAFGSLNPCLKVTPGGMPNSPLFAPPVLVQVHAHLINPDHDTDGGLDDFSSRHSGGVNVVFADGSVHFIRNVAGDPNPGDPGAVRSLYPPPYGSPGLWYSPDAYNYMGYATRAGGEYTTPLD
jgi:prepilin-type N-terminal cleavage/methylation domain-containing protein/prepilin-type processing-associated H-X9-DG protein